MKNSNDFKCYIFLLLVLMPAGISIAGIMAETTRLIFPQGVAERSLMIANVNKYPILVQTWVDDGDVNNTPEKTTSPFIVLPAVFRMNPDEVKGLRIVFKNQKLPDDRESVFWLNLYEIPPTKSPSATSDAELLVAMNTQMKIFYRPKALLKKSENIQESLQFTLMKEESKYVLNCYNPTGYYASFASLTLIVDGKEYTPHSKLDMMVAPFASSQFTFDPITGLLTGQRMDLNFTLINDAGLSLKGERKNIFISK